MEYLKEQWEKRQAEIKDGKNLGTRYPVYVVMSLRKHSIPGKYADYLSKTNFKSYPAREGYIDRAADEPEIQLTDYGMEAPEAWTDFYTDDPRAFFITSEAAHEYIEYQSHNMFEPYVYVFYTGYGNRQMDKIMQELGEV